MIILRHSITSKLLKKLPKVSSFYDICKLVYLCYIEDQFGNKFYEYDWKIYFEQTSALKLKIRIRGCAKSDIRPIPTIK